VMGLGFEILFVKLLYSRELQEFSIRVCIKAGKIK